MILLRRLDLDIGSATATLLYFAHARIETKPGPRPENAPKASSNNLGAVAFKIVPTKLHVFGLTGGIASGKSTVGAHFETRGVRVLDADQLARQAVAPGSAGLKAITQQFGSTVLDNGQLDRSALAELVFSAPKQLAALNAILHPQIAKLRTEHLSRWQAQGELLACYQVPLLFENDLQSDLQPVVLVAVSLETQLKRACLRDGLDERSVQNRISAQMPLAEKEKLATFVVDNNGSLESTLQHADRVLSEIYCHFRLN